MFIHDYIDYVLRKIIGITNHVLYFVRFTHLLNIQSDPYGSHIPVIILVLRLLKPLNIIETGSGYNSTGTFLALIDNNSNLTSIENDDIWFNKIEKAFKSNNYNLVFAKDISLWLKANYQLNDYDLILIDDSDNLTDRCNTISQIFSIGFNNLLIHDFDNHIYRKHVKSLILESKTRIYKLEFHFHYPHTLFLTTDKILFAKLIRNKKIIEKNYRLDSKSINTWIQLIDSFQN